MKILSASRQSVRARSSYGAVYVEFLIAFMPLFIFFLSLIQFIFVCTASVVTHYSAIKAVRAAIVVLPDDPMFYGGQAPGQASGARMDAILQAASVPFRTLGNSAPKLTMNASYGRDDLVTVKVDYPYVCKVPGGRWIACGANSIKTIHSEASLPNNGAEFRYSATPGMY
jgi:hypothetical protein